AASHDKILFGLELNWAGCGKARALSQGGCLAPMRRCTAGCVGCTGCSTFGPALLHGSADSEMAACISIDTAARAKNGSFTDDVVAGFQRNVLCFDQA